jgi:hypothetical protein
MPLSAGVIAGYRRKVPVARVSLAILTAALTLVGCEHSGEVQALPPNVTPTAVSEPLTEATWGDGQWPFSVSKGVLKCYVEDSMVTFTAGGVEYGLNATATRFGGFPSIAAIVPDGPLGFVEINGERQPVKTSGRSLEGINSVARHLCS